MNYRPILIYAVVLQLIWLAAFRCGNDYKKNSVITIEGVLVDEENNPLPYFQMYITHDIIYTTDFKHKNENVFRSDANGNILLVTPQPVQNFASDYFPMIKFVDTTWQNYSEYYWDTMYKPLILLPGNPENQRIVLDTIKLKKF